jgi:hypothetical protein
MGGRDAGQLLDDLRIADVAGMDDEVGPLQRRNRLRTHQPMGVRYDAHHDLALGPALGQILGTSLR